MCDSNPQTSGMRHHREGGPLRALFGGGCMARRAAVIYTETSGLNWCWDEIIEVSAVAFSYDQSGTIGEVTDIHSGL